MKKRFTCALVTALCLCLLAPAAFAALNAGTGDGYYAVDDAGVLSAETEELLADYNAVLEDQCHNAQFVVATVSYLDEDADIYATRLINDWGVGSASENNGMLLLLVTEEYRGGLTVGDGLDDAFYDSFPEKYYDAFWDDVDADRFDDAVRDLAGHIFDWYLGYYNVSLAAEPETNYADNYDYGYGYEPQPVSRDPSIVGIVVLILIALVVFWVIGAASRFVRMSRFGYTGGFMPIFLPGGRRRYRSWMGQRPPSPPPPPPGGFGSGFGPVPGPGGYRSPAPTRRSTFISRPPRSGGGFGGGTSSRPSGGSRPSAPRGGGFGGHGGGGFRGRR